MADQIPKSASEVYEFGPFRLDATERELFRGSDQVPLAVKVFDVLLLLVRNRGRTVSKDEFMAAVWADTVVEEANLTDNISRLRQILGDDPKEPQYIRTIPRRGYRFVADVQTPEDLILSETRKPDAETNPLAAAVRRPARVWMAVVVAAAVLTAATVIWFVATRREERARRVVRASILPPSGHRFWPSSLDHLSISPDARWVTFRVQSGDQRLWVRRIDSGEARPLPGTENAIFPMWSPDSASIAFFSGRKLRKVTLDGAPPRTICEVGNRPRRGDWSSSGEIIFSPDSTTALFRVSASGGTPVALTALVTARQETTHRWATFLPDDRHFLYYAGSHDLTVDSDMQGVFVASIGEPSRRKRLLRARSNAAYVDGHLIYAHAGALLAQRFDVKKLEMIGEPFSIANAIENDAQTFLSAFAVADDATIVFRSAPGNAARQLMWLGRMGVADGTAVGEQAAFRTVRLSPDGRSAVTVIDDPETGLGDLWIYDLISTERRQIPGKSGHETDPVWSPDGKRIAFTRSRGFRADARLFIVNADGSNERPLSEPPENAAPASWSVDGHTLFGTSWQPKRGVSRVTRWDVRDGRGTHLLDGYEPRVSPDGKWLLYTAGTHPDTSVWVAHTSDGSHRQKISREPAHALVWSGDRLLYATNTQIRVVTVTTTPERVNVVDEISAYHWDQGILYVDSLDGQRFFCVVQKEEEADRGISLVSDFAAALK